MMPRCRMPNFGSNFSPRYFAITLKTLLISARTSFICSLKSLENQTFIDVLRKSKNKELASGNQAF